MISRRFLIHNFDDQFIVEVVFFKSKNAQMLKFAGFLTVYCSKLNIFKFLTVDGTKQAI